MFISILYIWRKYAFCISAGTKILKIPHQGHFQALFFPKKTGLPERVIPTAL